MKLAKLILLLCGLSVLAPPPLSAANGTNLDLAIKYRQYVMRTQAAHLRAITKAIEGKLPYKEHFLVHAESLFATTQFMSSIFPAGSDLNHYDTDAKALIWEDWRGFSEQVDNARLAAAALRQAVIQGGDDAIIAAAERLNDACKACHRRYRSRR